jgi:hypothetical protein
MKMNERNFTKLAEGSCIEVDPGNLKCKIIINSIAISKAILPNQQKKLTQ